VNVEGDDILWLDAGATVLRSLEPVLAAIRETGYFLVSQGNAERDILPTSFFEEYGLPNAYGDRPYAAAGILGFRRGGEFFRRVVVPTYEDCLAGKSLGFSAGEAQSLNRGLGQGRVEVVHDCPHFRWDQSVFNARLLKEMPDAPLADLDEHAGWQSASDHPRQLVWHHRRRGSLRYLRRLHTQAPGRAQRYVSAVRLQLRWWQVRRSRRFTLTTIAWKMRAVTKRLRQSPSA
jgi:hypothetical protein